MRRSCSSLESAGLLSLVRARLTSAAVASFSSVVTAMVVVEGAVDGEPKVWWIGKVWKDASGLDVSR